LPDLAELYQILADNETFLINQSVAAMRDSPWRFAIVLAALPGFAHPRRVIARWRPRRI
jgi:hypothetical protein